jgi:hypothetical protein
MSKVTFKEDRKRWDDLKRELARVGTSSLVVGYPAEKDRQHKGSGMSNAELAGLHEFGSPGGRIPERPFLRSTFDAKREEWMRLTGKLLGRVLAGEAKVSQALGLLGARVTADCKNTVTQGSGLKANALSTVKRKGSDRPLIDTGRLVSGLTWVVRKAG